MSYNRAARAISLESDAMPAMSDQNRNTYCERLGIAVPRPEELLGQRELKLFELTVVVLLEYGDR
jgi:hypothetical protein